MCDLSKYPECFIGSIVNPGEYYLVSKRESHVLKIKQMEEVLSKEMAENDNIPHANDIKADNYLAIEVSGDGGSWKRGRALCKLGSSIFKVFLIDSGRITQVSTKNIRLLYEKFLKVEPLAFRFRLHGIIPCIVLPDQGRKQVSETWTEGSKYFISTFLFDKNVVYLNIATIINRTILGDLFVCDKRDNQVFSVSRLLCMKIHAIYSLTYYAEKVMTLDPGLLDPRVLETDAEAYLRIGYRLRKMEDSRLANVLLEGDWNEIKELKAKTDNGGSKLNEKSDPGTGTRNRENRENVFKPYSMKNTLRYHSQSNKNKPNNAQNEKSHMEVANASGMEGLPSDPPEKSLQQGQSPKSKGEQTLDSLKENQLLKLQKGNRAPKSMKTKEEIDVSDLSDGDSEISEAYEISGQSKRRRPSTSKEVQLESEEFRVIFEEKYALSKLGTISCHEMFQVFYEDAVQPVNKFEELRIWEIIVKGMEREAEFVGLTPIQRYAIPAIADGHDLIVLGGPKTGKTLSYVVGFLENLRLKMSKRQLKAEKGPMAVILCIASRTCEHVQRSFNVFTTKRNRKVRVPIWELKVRFVNGNITERHSVAPLLNDCDVLVTTPHCFVRILKQRKVSVLERLHMIVFDEADISTQEPFLTQIKILLHQAKLPKKVQKVFCAEKWTPQLKDIADTFAKNHSIVIGSYMETMIYTVLKPEVIHIADKNKDEVLGATLKRFQQHKIAVVCSRNEEIFHIENLLKRKNQPCFIAHSDIVTEELKAVCLRWERSTCPCTIICSDAVLDDLDIHNANVLINYSLPADWKVSFSNRFSLIMQRLRDNFYQDGREDWPIIIVLLEKKIHFQLPQVMEFLQRLGIEIPSDFGDLCRNIENQIEFRKRHLQLCERILKFGFCKNMIMCKKRHTFYENVDSPVKSLYGAIKFRVLKVHSTNHISVRIVEFVDQGHDFKKTDLEDLSLDISRRLRRHFYRKEHRKPISLVTVNSLCILNRCDMSGIKYHRVRILEFKKLGTPGKPLEVLVKLIDWGHVMSTPVDKLFDLPEGLKKYPPQSTDIYLCNLLPRDFDPDWSDRTITYAKNMFLQSLDENQIWMGQIKLCLNSGLFVDNIKLCQSVKGRDTPIINFSCGPKLISCGIAAENTEHLDTLYSMCKDANIDTFAYEYDSDVDESSHPDSAFFDKDFLKVQFLSAESVSKIYVRISKFKDLLRNLEKECTKDGNKKDSSEFIIRKKSGAKKKLMSGKYCLAKYGSSWNRAKIYSFEDDKVKVFFIDYGDFECTDKVVPIPEKLLTQLPCQAIECYLAGVDPESEITEEILGKIYNFSNDGNDEVYVNVVEKNIKSPLTGGWRYGINLLNAEGKSLNKKLIDSRLVRPGNNSELAVDKEDMPPDSESNVGSSDESDIEFNNKYDNIEEDVISITENSSIERPSINNAVRPREKSEKIDEMSYFLNMDSEVFDDENAFCMLEEFVTQVAPGRIEPQIQEITETETEASDSLPDKIVCDDEGAVSQGNDVSTDAEVANVLSGNDETLDSTPERDRATSPLGGMAYFLRKWKVRNGDSSLPYMKYFPEKNTNSILSKHLLPTNFLTPEIFWSQTPTEVEVKIMLNSVQDYKLECVIDRFVFRTCIGDKYYVSNVRLFGGIIPDKTRFEIKTFFVQMVFQKLCPMLWPRLCRDNQKFRWIKYNIEHFTERKCTIPEIICSQAIERIEAGDIITPKVTDEVKFVPSSDSDGSDWSDSDEEVYGLK